VILEIILKHYFEIWSNDVRFKRRETYKIFYLHANGTS